eukprot:s1951_g7.t1
MRLTVTMRASIKSLTAQEKPVCTLLLADGGGVVQVSFWGDITTRWQTPLAEAFEGAEEREWPHVQLDCCEVVPVPHSLPSLHMKKLQSTSGPVVHFLHPGALKICPALAMACADFSVFGSQIKALWVHNLLDFVLQQSDCDHMALIGHSLGAAGAWRYLRAVPSCPFRFVLFMDLWPAVLLEEDFSFSPTVDYAIMLSEEWMKNPRFLRGNGKLAANSGKCLATLQSPGTSHQWISETQMIMPFFVLKRMGLMGAGDWYRCYGATVQASAQLVMCGLGRRSKAEAMQAIEKLDPDLCKSIQFPECNDLPVSNEE